MTDSRLLDDAWRAVREDLAVQVILDQLTTAFRDQLEGMASGQGVDAERVRSIDALLVSLEFRTRALLPELAAIWTHRIPASWHDWMVASVLGEYAARIPFEAGREVAKQAFMAGWHREPEL